MGRLKATNMADCVLNSLSLTVISIQCCDVW